MKGYMEDYKIIEVNQDDLSTFKVYQCSCGKTYSQADSALFCCVEPISLETSDDDFGMSVIEEDLFRSTHKKLNEDYDMVRVTLDFSLWNWKRFKRYFNLIDK